MYNAHKLISDAIELSKLSNIPVLFLGNPGVAKTTVVKSYAKSNGYEVEELIGSQSTPEEILGYQVNEEGMKSLSLKFPDWFVRILERSEKNISTLLFIDEITTTSPYVQAALLKLIFDRQIGRTSMPNDCLIVSAGNYKDNLGGIFEMLSPTLNRFMIVNMKPESVDSNEYNRYFINNFCKVTPPELTAITYNTHKLSDDIIMSIESDVTEFFHELFNRFGSNNSSNGLVDMSYTKICATYDVEGNVYGVVTPRILHYVTKLIAATISSGIPDIDNLIDGLIGAGTCQFTDKQAVAYRNWTHKCVSMILTKYQAEVGIEDEDLIKLSKFIDESTDYDFITKISNDISNLYINKGVNVNPIVYKSIDKFKSFVFNSAILTKLFNSEQSKINKSEGTKFIDAIDSIKLLSNTLGEHIDELTNLIDNVAPLYEQIVEKYKSGSFYEGD